jgi:DNA-directed RNA polymerase subunit M/transcription elongation factor TFIIS
MTTIEATVTSVDGIGNENDALIRKLVQNGVLQLNPTLEKAAVRYVEAEAAWSAGSAQVKVLLDDLVKSNFLKKEPLDRVLTCPHCGSPEMHSKYACPRCKSDDVEFTELIEHIKCGNIGSKETFLKGNSLVCPRCNTVLTEDSPDNRIIGNFYQCEKCGHRFDRPDVIHICMNCGTLSTHQNAKYRKVFRYLIPDEIVQKLQKELPVLKSIKHKLTDKGFNVQTNVRIKGVSGAESVFDILAEKEDIRLAIDVSTTGDKKDLIALLAKKVDVNPTQTAFVDLSGSGIEDNLAKVYGISVLKTASDHTVLEGFDQFLKTLENKQPSKTKN